MQDLRPLIFETAERSRLKAASNVRSELPQGLEVSWNVWHNAVAERNDDERRQLAYFMSLGELSQEKAAQYDAAIPDMCVFCGARSPNLKHRYWKCEALHKLCPLPMVNDKRVDPDFLHPALLVGLPPAMHVNSRQSFWGSEFPRDFQGDAQPYGEYFSGQTIHPVVNGLLLNRAPDEHLLNARQFFQLKRTVILESECDAPTTSWSDASPPVHPNTYSDGGVKSSANHRWALGSFGVTWPGRKAEDMPFSKSEQDFTFHQVRALGLDLWGPIPGHRCSSTRAELMGGIASLTGPGPIHIGVDSQAFLDRARFFHNKALQIVTEPIGMMSRTMKPWHLIRDGDLWHIFWDLLLAKSPSAVSFTKVKGHATDKDIKDGLSTATHKAANDQADAMASKGVRENAAGLVDLSALLVRQEQRYAEFLNLIHSFILNRHNAIIAEDRRLSTLTHGNRSCETTQVVTDMLFCFGSVQREKGRIPHHP